jgi:hypothetical protein
MGPVRPEQLAREWLIPLHNAGDVMKLLVPHDYEGIPGKYALIVGNPIKGFSITGTFPSRLTALHWRDTQMDLDDYWVVELEEYYQWRG